MMRAALFAAGVWFAGSAGLQAGCATLSDDACAIAEGGYHIALPDGVAAPPAVVFLHGWGSSGGNAIANQRIVAPMLARGYAVITPDGVPRENGPGRSWSFHPDLGQARDEVSFLSAVAADAASRHGIDRDRMILTGFSIGGSMTAYAACDRPGTFDAYAPLGGNFWRPHPQACSGPVRLLHTHGWTDGTVPLEGRLLRDGALIQGDVFAALEIWRRTNGCDALRADRFAITEAFWRRAWDRCRDGSALELALFPGGHVVPDGWPDLMLDWYEAL